MIRYICTLLLAGCATVVPVKMPFPKVAEQMTLNCPDLQTVADTETKLSVLLQTVGANYAQYYQCSELVKAWNTWYIENKKISEE